MSLPIPARRAIAGLASIALAAMLLACVEMPPADETLAVTRVAEGVYAFIGSSGEAALANRGEVGNGGFIVGETATVMINTGSSYRHGLRMIDAARRTGGKPVVLALVTQPLQEFVMGSAAFAEEGIPLLAPSASVTLIRQRCERCLRTLTRLLGEDVMRGTRVIEPQRELEASTALMVGGRPLRLLSLGWAQTPGDLAVFDERSGVLFAGALVSIGRVPELRDADPSHWRSALADLQAMPVRRLVPGYGPVGTTAAIAGVTGYLDALEGAVRGLLRSGASLSEAIPAAAVPAYAQWSLYDVVHPRNVQQTYLRLESEAFGG